MVLMTKDWPTFQRVRCITSFLSLDLDSQSGKRHGADNKETMQDFNLRPVGELYLSALPTALIANAELMLTVSTTASYLVKHIVKVPDGGGKESNLALHRNGVFLNR